MKQPNNGGAQKPVRPYFRAAAPAARQLLRLQSLGEFIRLLDLYNAKAIFLIDRTDGDNGGPEAAEGGTAFFAIPYEGGLITQPTLGYQSLEDFQQARTAGFEQANEYYEATAEGYRQYEDYRMAREAGIGEAAIMEAMRKAGFVEGFQTYQLWMAGGDVRPEGAADIGEAENPYALYLAAQAHGFVEWRALERSLLQGFTQGGDYEAAQAKGFQTAAEYDDATRRGFGTRADYDFANEHHIRDAAECRTYLDLNTMSGATDMPHDQKLLLAMLSRLEQGKRASVNRLWEHLQKSLDEYRYADTGELPRWLTTGLADRPAVATFLRSNENALAFGNYDADGEFFESKRLQEREVIVDASNVAYNSANRRDNKPTVANLLLMARFLRAQGFEHISFIADASLKHRLGDAELMETLEAEAEYIESPAERPADVFLIQYVRQKNCLLVSNDTFREWKLQEPWVANHIDYYRLTFMIKDDEVLMPDLKA